MSKPLLALFVFLVAMGSVVAWIVVSQPAHERAPVGQSNSDEKQRDAAVTEKSGKRDETPTPEKQAEIDYNAQSDANQRLALIERVGAADWARHDTPLLRKAILADGDERVQLAALAKSVALAEKHSPKSIHEVVRAGLSTANPRVVQQSLREARKHPSAELVPDLIEIADSAAAHRFLAIDALAFTDDPKAKAKVIEWAGREDGDKIERIRAVALLSKVKCPESEALLARLCGSSDEEVRKVAVEAYAAYCAK